MCSNGRQVKAVRFATPTPCSEAKAACGGTGEPRRFSWGAEARDNIPYVPLFSLFSFAHTIATVQWRLIQVAGRIVRHAGQVILKLVLDPETLSRFHQIRQQCFVLSGAT